MAVEKISKWKQTFIKKCLPVIRWNKKHSRKSFSSLLFLKVCESFQFRQSKNTCSALWSVWMFFAFLDKRRPNTCCLWEGLKWICKFFEINAQQDFLKLVIFSIFSKHFLIELTQGNSYQICLVSYSDSGILCFFPLSYNGNNLSVKLLKSLCQYILLFKS